VLLLVEGPSDKGALPILARKLIGSRVGVTALAVGKGDLLSAKRVEVHISYAMARQKDILKAVLCVDSECTDIERTRARIETVAQEVAQNLTGVSIRAIVVDHSLEGWLLYDRPAVAQFLGITERWLGYRNPEHECRPANLMDRLFRRAGRDFIKTRDLPDLANRIDPGQVALLSPTFNEFKLAITEG
jgi:hypothetical protein